jgi:hypothetical protein
MLPIPDLLYIVLPLEFEFEGVLKSNRSFDGVELWDKTNLLSLPVNQLLVYFNGGMYAIYTQGMPFPCHIMISEDSSNIR